MGFALLVGLGVFLVSLLSYAMTTALIVNLVVRVNRTGYAALGFWPNVVVMMIASLIMAATHLVQIVLWAVPLWLCGEISPFEKAIYCSAGYYTTLGSPDILLSERWRLLGPLEAINGFLLFGLSTAALFAVLSRLITSRLHLHPGHPDEEGVHREPSSVGGAGQALE
jgi:hypothetical protein